MRKVLVLAAAIAAASCGGNSSDLTPAEAQSIASEISAALQSHEAAASVQKQLMIGPISNTVTYNCVEGKLIVSGSLNINCPSGLQSCTTDASLTIDATNKCTTSTGVTIEGLLTVRVTGTGLSFTKTVTGELTITRPDGTVVTCNAGMTLAYGRMSGSICGVPVSR